MIASIVAWYVVVDNLVTHGTTATLQRTVHAKIGLPVFDIKKRRRQTQVNFHWQSSS
jgi:hypothetical protein